MIERIGHGLPRATRFEYVPNHREPSPTPYRLHNGHADETVVEFFPRVLSSSFYLAPEENPQPATYLLNEFRIPYPLILGSYLRIEGYGLFPDPLGTERPELFMVVDLTAPINALAGAAAALQGPTVLQQEYGPSGGPMAQFVLPSQQTRREPPIVSRVGFIGELALPPTYDDRGPLHNFGLPRSVRIYAVPWLKPFTPANLPPHPRTWQLLYENTDFRARWGWTFADFAPVRTSHLLFAFGNLPRLPDLFDEQQAKLADSQKAPWQFRGLAIERLAIHEYQAATDFSEIAPFVPAVSWTNKYESQPNPFQSRFWQARNIAPISEPLNQSIYREAMAVDTKQPWGIDLQPSALVGLPLQARIVGDTGDATTTTDGYAFRDYYSGDLVIADRTAETALVIEMTDSQPPSLRGLRLRVPPFARPEQNLMTHVNEAVCTISATDDPMTAFSSKVNRPGWKRIGSVPFDFSLESSGALFNFFYGQEILFEHDVNYRFYRIELSFEATGAFNGPKRFEVSALEPLRSKHHTLVASSDAMIRLEELQIRLTGPSLLDDYDFVNGREVMDLRIERSTGEMPYDELLCLRSMLDVREKASAQVIARQRTTRPRLQFFTDRSLSASQETLTVSLQQMIGDPAGAAQFTNDALVTNLPSADPAAHDVAMLTQARIQHILASISGITTDRNVDLDRMLPLVQVMDAAGVPASDIVKLMNLASNSKFWDLAGTALDEVWGGLGDAATVGLILGTGGLAAFFGLGDDDRPPARAINFGLLGDPVEIVRIINAIPPASRAQMMSALRQLSYRPSVSLSGSFGAQFIGGGSFGISGQLDGGKSTALSSGDQGQAMRSVVVSGESERQSSREENIERTEWSDWKAQDVKLSTVPTDIVTIRIPVGVTLTPPSSLHETPDRFRVKVNLLPPNVKVEVRFIGQRQPIDHALRMTGGR